MIRVYIASPYTKGDQLENVKRQIKVAHKLIDLGFAPYLPLLCHFQHTFLPRAYEDWLKLDFEWIQACDVLLRLEGDSEGADKEVEYAKELGLRIVYSIDKLKIHLVK